MSGPKKAAKAPKTEDGQDAAKQSGAIAAGGGIAAGAVAEVLPVAEFFQKHEIIKKSKETHPPTTLKSMFTTYLQNPCQINEL